MNSIDATTDALEKYLKSLGYFVYTEDKKSIKSILKTHFEGVTDSDLDMELSHIMDAN